MKKILALFILLMISSFGHTAISANVKDDKPIKNYEGLFGICGPQRTLDKRLELYESAFRRSSWLSGMLAIVWWKNLQPGPDKFDWSEADKLVNLARKYNKRVFLFLRSDMPPDWVYEEGVQKYIYTDSNPHHKTTYGSKQIVPMPLSEKFYALWARLIKEAGKRYDGDPTVAASVIMGVNFHHGGEIRIKFYSEEEKREAEKFDITAENVIHWWKRYIDLYMEAFPNTYCKLHIAEIFQRGSPVLGRVVAYGAEKYPDRFIVQTCGLNGRKDEEGQEGYDLVRKYSSKIAVGFQMLSSFKEDPNRQGSMLMTLMNGMRGGAKYYELWTGDATAPEVSKAFYDLWQEGKQIGWEKLMERAKANGEYKTLGDDTYYLRKRELKREHHKKRRGSRRGV